MSWDCPTSRPSLVFSCTADHIAAELQQVIPFNKDQAAQAEGSDHGFRITRVCNGNFSVWEGPGPES